MLRVYITKTIFEDLCVRCPDPDGAWKGIDRSGYHDVSEQQAREIRGDADFQGNVTGNYIDPVSGGLTRAYRALYRQLDVLLRKTEALRRLTR